MSEIFEMLLVAIVNRSCGLSQFLGSDFRRSLTELRLFVLFLGQSTVLFVRLLDRCQVVVWSGYLTSSAKVLVDVEAFELTANNYAFGSTVFGDLET